MSSGPNLAYLNILYKVFGNVIPTETTILHLSFNKWRPGSTIRHVTASRCQCIMKVIVMYDDIIYTSVVMEPFVFPPHLQGHPVCPWVTDGILLRLSSTINNVNNRFSQSPAEQTFGQTRLMTQTAESFFSLSTNGKSSIANEGFTWEPSSFNEIRSFIWSTIDSVRISVVCVYEEVRRICKSIHWGHWESLYRGQPCHH